MEGSALDPFLKLVHPTLRDSVISVAARASTLKGAVRAIILPGNGGASYDITMCNW
jgi:hypothetical protein